MTAITREDGQSFRPVETNLFTPLWLGPYELPIYTTNKDRRPQRPRSPVKNAYKSVSAG